MAGDWIKMRTNLDSDPRVIAMAGRLGVHELHVVGMLWKVWAWADSHTLDGNAIRVTNVTLDRFTTVTGFADALREVGWLDGRDGSLSFPRFAEHNGQTAKNRAETKVRVAKHRNGKCVTSVTQKVLPEKRREEKSNKTITSNEVICDERVHSSPPTRVSETSNGSAGMVFAMQAATWDMPERILAEYVSAYSFDVRAELMKAALWLRDNKDRRPRAVTGLKKFLTRWLNRRADSSSKPSSQLAGRIKNDPKLEEELARTARILRERKEAIRNGKVPSIPTD